MALTHALDYLAIILAIVVVGILGVGFWIGSVAEGSASTSSQGDEHDEGIW